MRYTEHGNGLATLEVWNSEYLFGHGVNWTGDLAQIAIGAGNLCRPYQYTLVSDVFAAAIAEDSEVRGVYIGHEGRWIPCVEGCPVTLQAKRGTQILLAPLDATDGSLALRLQVRDSQNLTYLLPTLIADHCRVRIRAQFDAATTAILFAQAPRLRGVRHRAALYNYYHDGANNGDLDARYYNFTPKDFRNDVPLWPPVNVAGGGNDNSLNWLELEETTANVVAAWAGALGGPTYLTEDHDIFGVEPQLNVADDDCYLHLSFGWGA